ncbi:MAG: hypothetical protein U5K00_12330 [Melioribacteraceae bacterium]|nr:hypothetical protein [Melioribacteraceae bacterium]
MVNLQVHLGKGCDPRPLNLPFDTKYFLGVKINDNPEMEQRLEFVSSPYSLSTKIAETVPDNSITGEKFAPESVTNDKIKNISLRKLRTSPGIGTFDKLNKYASVQGSDFEWWTTFGNLIWGPERHFLGTRNERNFVIGTHEIQRMLFDPYGYIVLGTAQDSVDFEVIGKTTFVDGYIKGKLGVGVDPAEAKMHINVPGINKSRS